MALAQDKRKPVNIYDPESATAKAQQTGTDIVTAPMRFAGRQLDAATAPAQRLAEKTVVPMATAVGGKVLNLPENPSAGDVAMAVPRLGARAVEATTAPGRRAISAAGDTVANAADAVGNRLVSDAAATTNAAQRVGLRQAIQQAPQGDVAGIRQAEASNPAPAPPPAKGQQPLTDVAVTRALDAELYGPDGVKRIGGNAPSAATPPATPPPATATAAPNTTRIPGNNIDVHLTPQDRQLKENLGKIDQMLASGVVPTAAQSQSIAQLRRDAGFLRGGTDRVPVGPDGLPLRLGGGGGSVPGGVTDSGLSVQFTKNVPDQVRREVMQPLGANDPVAQAAREKQGKQFLSRQGVEEADPVTGMTPSQERALPVKERVALVQAKIGAKSDADRTDVARITAGSQAAESKVGLKMKENSLAAQEKTNKLLDEYAKATPDRRAAIENELVLMGAKQPRAEKAPKVHFQKTYDEFGKVIGEEPFLLDEDTGEGRPIRMGGGGGTKRAALPKRIPDRKVGEEYETANGVFKWDGKGLIRVK
jgi:hypothetical protein